MKQRIIVAISVTVLITLVSGVHIYLWTYTSQFDMTQVDTYYTYLDGSRMLAGENPYARIHAGDMRNNDKYPTFFPFFYGISAFSQWAGLRDYADWLSFWRFIFLLFDAGVAVTLFLVLERRAGLALGMFAALFWLLSRWSLVVNMFAGQDVIAIFLLIVSLLLLEQRRGLSLLLFSLSLAVKHLAIFVAPLYLIWIWQATGKDRTRQMIAAALVIASVPLLSSLPYLIWDAEAFLKSLLFQVTRNPGTHFNAPSLDEVLGLVGFPARIPMFTLMLLVFVGAAKRRIGKYASVLFVLSAFVDLNPVLFTKYLAWVVPFVPLVLCDADFAGVRELSRKTLPASQTQPVAGLPEQTAEEMNHDRKHSLAGP